MFWRGEPVFLSIEKGFYDPLEFVCCYLGGAVLVKDLETQNSERHKAIESAKLYWPAQSFPD